MAPVHPNPNISDDMRKHVMQKLMLMCEEKPQAKTPEELEKIIFDKSQGNPQNYANLFQKVMTAIKNHPNRQGASNNSVVMQQQQVRPPNQIRQDGNCPLNALQTLAGSAGGPSGSGVGGVQQGQMMMQQQGPSQQQPNMIGGSYQMDPGQSGVQNPHLVSTVQRVSQPMQRVFLTNPQYQQVNNQQQHQDNFNMQNSMNNGNTAANVSISSDNYGIKVASVNYNMGNESTPGGIPRVSSGGHLSNMQMEQPGQRKRVYVSTIGGVNAGPGQSVQLRQVNPQSTGPSTLTPNMMRIQTNNNSPATILQPQMNTSRPPSTGGQPMVRTVQDELTLRKLEEIQMKYANPLQFIIQHAKDANERQKFMKIQQILANPHHNLQKLHDSAEKIRNVIEQQYQKTRMMTQANSPMVPTPSGDSNDIRSAQTQPPSIKDSVSTSSGPVEITSTSMASTVAASRAGDITIPSKPSSTVSRKRTAAPTANASSSSASAAAPQTPNIISSMWENERPPEMGFKLKQMITEYMSDSAQMDRFLCARRQTFEELAPVRDQIGVREIPSLPDSSSKSSDNGQTGRDCVKTAKIARLSGDNEADSTINPEDTEEQEEGDKDVFKRESETKWDYENIEPRQTFPNGENGLGKLPQSVIDEIRSISTFLEWDYNDRPPKMCEMETDETCVDPEEWNNSWHLTITHRHKHLPYDIPPLFIRLPEDYESRRVANWFIDESAYVAEADSTLVRKDDHQSRARESIHSLSQSSSIDRMLQESLVAQEFNLNRKEFLEELVKETKFRFNKLRHQHESQWSLTRILNVWMTSVLQGLSNAIGYRNLICNWRTNRTDSMLSSI